MKWILLNFLSLFVIFIGLTGCEERIDEPVSPSTGEKLVAVSLNFGFAEDNDDGLYRNGSPQREPRIPCVNTCIYGYA
ncbi:hypothetical protein [Bacteroides sp.]|uniref:hypothetical protein n=1 Tax=Bacteroides sp. TaxID=29523 RepID=UPI0026055F52|nr:hypothetical protein [Bacteroides sp.]